VSTSTTEYRNMAPELGLSRNSVPVDVVRCCWGPVLSGAARARGGVTCGALAPEPVLDD